MYTRKTKDEYQIHAHHGAGTTWEEIDARDT